MREFDSPNLFRYFPWACQPSEWELFSYWCCMDMLYSEDSTDFSADPVLGRCSLMREPWYKNTRPRIDGY